ncbi:MBL fold metallo-hydrolase [Actinoplanes sp. NPDC020271]|uniref:MBL fold metallo-hydrolase n=1 Tax=Actinoplanes sp. NPDC020271 TaxID=3363896 RepID=UPI0037A24EFF
MREVVDGVFELRLGVVNVHLVVTDDGVILVDTGLPGQAAAIEQAARPLGPVQAILLTHHHPDHAGGAADLRRRTGARLIAHAAEAPHLTGHFQAEEPEGRLRKFLFRRLEKIEPTKIDQLVGDRAEPLPDFTVIHTPGHTRGHLSFHLARAGGVLFAGDAATSRNGKVVGAVEKLAGFDADHAVFGHGRPISGEAAARFREAAAAIKPE